MVKTYTAQSVGVNHDWDFSVDSDGKITAMVVRAEVNYGTMGMTESLDIWELLNSDQKAKMQFIYDKVALVFNKHFV